MRIRSGHIIIAIGTIILAMVAFILLNAAPNQEPLAAAPDKTATVPPEGTDPGLVPAMEVESMEKDLGVVPNTGNSMHPFVIRNTGKATLHIRDVKTSCACTVPHIPPNGLDIPPMGEGTMQIEIVPARIQGFEARRVITLFTNDPMKLTQDVGITSHVDPEFSLEPIELDFGEVPKGAGKTMTMVLKQIQDAPMEVKEMNIFGHTKADTAEGASLAAQTGDFTLEVVKRPETSWATPGKVEYDLHVGITPAMSAGSLEGKKVFVVTTAPRLPVVPIMLHGKVTAPYTLDPAPPKKIAMRADPATMAIEPSYATLTADAPVTVEDIQPATPSLAMEVEPGATPNDLRLKVSVTESAPAGALEEDIKFNVNIGGTKYPEHIGVRSFVMKK